jgi:hypothetical protein
MSKTTITISARARAAYAALRADYPALTLSDFYEQAVTFYLAYRDEATFAPTLKHLSTITTQLDSLSQQLTTVVHPPPVDHHHLANLLAKTVLEQLPKPPPPVLIPGIRGWLIRRWQKRYGDIANSLAHTRRYGNRDS